MQRRLDSSGLRLRLVATFREHGNERVT